MFEGVLNTPALRLYLTMFCVIKTNIWWDMSNSYMSFLEYSRKFALTTSPQKDRRSIDSLPLTQLIQYPHTFNNNTYHSSKGVPPLFFHSDTNSAFCHVLNHSFDKTHVLVVTEELTWLLVLNILSFKFVSTPNKFLLGWQDSEEAM